jgi:hypothetical protein
MKGSPVNRAGNRMAFWRLHYHLVWSTYGREPLINLPMGNVWLRFSDSRLVTSFLIVFDEVEGGADKAQNSFRTLRLGGRNFWHIKAR